MQTARGRAFLHVQEEGNGAMRFGRVLAIALCVFALGSETMAKNGRARTLAAPSGEMVQPQDGTGNLSKQHRDDLVRKLGAIKNFLEASKDTNAVQLLRFAAEVEKEVCTKKYGLVFEEHKERVDVELERNLPVLTEDKKRFIDNGGEVNFLIEGDNLAALKLLEKTHRGKIDLIYIDPPYNTENKEFVYDDKCVEPTDLFRHSKWLSFMAMRLRVARKLLSDNGVIFVSIDDHEQAPLKMLCDEIFREDNFVGTYFWKRTNTPPALSHKIRRKFEFVLCYQKQEMSNRKYAQGLVDGDDAPLLNAGNPIGVLTFPIGSVRFHIPDGTYTGDSRAKVKLLSSVVVRDGVNVKEFSAEGHFKWGQSNLDEEVRSGTYFLVKSKKFSIRYQKPEKATKVPSNIIDLEVGVGTNEDAQKELEELSVAFDYAKPTSLIEYLIKMPFWDDDKVTVLDFFAGSGTTGHAVMNLNAKDGGKRKFILVTNNENEICEKVTYERLKRVIEKEDYAARLKYYKIGYVPIDEKVYYEYANDLLKHIRELVELENAVDFSKDKAVAIALTDTELEKLAGNGKRLEACKAVYVGHDVLISSAIKAMLKKHGVKVNIIPQYYYPELEG